MLYKMGVIHSRLGQRREATRYSEQALQIEKRIDNRIGEAYLYTIAFFYSRIGRYETAIELYEQALEVVREMGDKWQERRALNFIAWNHYLLHQYEKALVCLKQGLEIARGMGYRRGEAISLSDMGLMYENMEQYERALECYELASYINREIDHKFGALSDLIGLGNIYKHLGQYSRALTHFKEGLDLALRIRSLDFIWKAQRCVGSVLEAQGKEAEALQYYRYSVATIESIRDQLEVEAFQTYFLIENPPVYSAIVGLLTRTGRYDEAFEYAERAKARSLLGILAQGELNLTETLAPELLEAKKTMEQRIRTVNSRLTKGYSEKIDKGVLNGLEDSLKLVRIEHQDLLRQIEMNRPARMKLSGNSRSLTLKDIRQRVLGGKDSPILVEYLVDKECTHVWVVDGHSLGYRRIDMSEDQLEKMIRHLLDPFQDLQHGKTEVLNLPYDLVVAYLLYQKIFQPVEEYLKEDALLIIIPDGILHNLPFGALVTEIEPREPKTDLFFARYENARYLIEKYSISYTPSASVLDPILRKPRYESGIKGRLLAFGNPNLGPSDLEGAFEPLPETGREVNIVSEVFGPSGCEVFSGRDAREGLFKEKAGQFRYLHLATHSVLEDTDPLYSKIVFALDDDPEEDGFLEAYEIFDLRLNAHLVVLSSCETGLGRLSAGEGLIGLVRAFMYAGAPSILASLWSVGNPTTKMMEFFYQNLKDGMNKAEALRLAKIRMIHNQDEEMSYAHPFLWAPFVLLGDWR
ncbi:MAG: CHAT domain-containing protein [bacterium]